MKKKNTTKQKRTEPSDRKGKPKRLSALDAAAEVLKKAGRPMHCTDLITTMAQQGLWTSPKGATPHATLYAAILREGRKRGEASRFRKVGRGKFEYTDKTNG